MNSAQHILSVLKTHEIIFCDSTAFSNVNFVDLPDMSLSQRSRYLSVSIKQLEYMTFFFFLKSRQMGGPFLLEARHPQPNREAC